MCLQNERTLGVFNGMQGTIGALFPPHTMRFDADGREFFVDYVPEQFNREERPEYIHNDPNGDKKRLPFDYCYCITCHKAQGDEFDRVLVIEQKCRAWDNARWAYTAASRARVRLDWTVW
jgi:ATP-dependent exoDNAse (exonuclease V) alpha subunit